MVFGTRFLGIYESHAEVRGLPLRGFGRDDEKIPYGLGSKFFSKMNVSSHEKPKDSSARFVVKHRNHLIWAATKTIKLLLAL